MKKISDKVTKNKSKHLLVENELKELGKFNAPYFTGKNYFGGNDRVQNSLVFQVGEKYLKNNSGGNSLKIIMWIQKVYLANH